MALLENENHHLPAISIANCDNLQSGITDNMTKQAMIEYVPVHSTQFDGDEQPLNAASELNFN